MGKEVIGMLKAQPVPVPRIEGAAGAAFLIYYGEVNQDSDGPVEFCWPVPQNEVGQLAASLPGLTLGTEPVHQEAHVRVTRTCRRRSGKPSRTRPGLVGRAPAAGQ